MTTDTELKTIEQVRAFNRFYTREMGILNERYLDDRFTLPELRALFEVAGAPSVMVTQLAESLAMDQGYVSRIIKTLKKQGLITSVPDSRDGRKKILTLTQIGTEILSELEVQVRANVGEQLSSLTPEDRQMLVGAMTTITRLLKPSVELGRLIRPLRMGDIGLIAHRHAKLYSREYGWGQGFELTVMQVLTEFLAHPESTGQQGWVAEVEGEFAGSVFAVREDEATARLRALLMEPKFRGLGLGNQLINQCLDYCRAQNYKKIVLWTCDILTQARKLYDRNGFVCTRQWTAAEFGIELVNEHWELEL